VNSPTKSAMEISPAQSLAARGLLNLSLVRLARLANLSQSRVREFEKGRRKLAIDELEAIRRALRAKGVEFTNGDQPGVRLKKADGVIRATWDPPPKT
jgi:transcriptional regulator with XRE-family HTH domain